MTIITHSDLVAKASEGLPNIVDYSKYLGSNSSGLYTTNDLVMARRVCLTVYRNTALSQLRELSNKANEGK